MAIDDLDKVFRGKKFAQEFATVTHMLTSGASRQYAAVVKGNLPDLYWSFCGMAEQ